MLENITYFSDGLKIAAHLYRPDDWRPGDPPRPAVVCVTGYSGRKNLATIDMPIHLSKAGFFTLAPDYRGYGVSEGVRGRHRPLEQAQDTYDGITYLQTVEGVDPERIGLYGTSFGGAHAIWAAAFDERVKATVSAVGVHDGERWLKTLRRPYEWLAFKSRVQEAARRRVTANERETIIRHDIYSDDPDNPKPPMTLEEHGSEEVLDLDLESVEACFRYRPEWVAGKISPRPVLFIYGEEDVMVPPSEAHACYAACGEPKKLVMLPRGRHNDVYQVNNPDLFDMALKETTAWFREHL